jgi:hypothetical protein
VLSRWQETLTPTHDKKVANMFSHALSSQAVSLPYPTSQDHYVSGGETARRHC